MAQHTEEQMAQMTLEELKTHDREEAAAVAVVEPVVPAKEAEIVKPEPKPYRLVIDDREAFESDEPLEFTPAQQKYLDKLADSKRHANKKIREMSEKEAKEAKEKLEAQAPNPTELTEDQKYVRRQQWQQDPDAAAERVIQEALEARERQAEAARVEKERVEQEKAQGVTSFLEAHPDYIQDGIEGTKNNAVINQYLMENRLPPTFENLTKAYLDRSGGGLLTLKNREAKPDTKDKAKEPEQIAQPKAEAAPQVTRKTSGISTQSSRTVAPANTESSEDDAYGRLTTEQVRQLGSKQMKGEIEKPSWAR